MKKWLVILICLVLLFGVVGCNQTDEDTDSSEETSAVDSEDEDSSESEVELVSITEDGVTFSLPEGFEKMEDAPMYVTENYPDVPDSFIFDVNPKTDESGIDSMTKEQYTEMMQALFPGLSIDVFEKTTIADLPALKIEYSYSIEGESGGVVHIFLEGEETVYSFQYAYTTSELKDSVEECIASISIAK